MSNVQIGEEQVTVQPSLNPMDNQNDSELSQQDMFATASSTTSLVSPQMGPVDSSTPQMSSVSTVGDMLLLSTKECITSKRTHRRNIRKKKVNAPTKERGKNTKIKVRKPDYKWTGGPF